MKRFFLMLMLAVCGTSLFALGRRDRGEEDTPPPPPELPMQEELYIPELPLEPFIETPVESEPAVTFIGVNTLAILPFAGVTTGDGEALALLFSNNQKLRTTYNVVPLTRNVQQRVRTEQQAVTGGSTQTPINLVMIGIVRNIRGNNVMLVNIVDRLNRQLIAGDFRIYRDPSELQTLIPAMVDYMIQGAQKVRLGLRKLAVTPFDTPQPSVSAAEAEMLALLLSAEIATSGQYAVLPRMDPLLLALDQVDQVNQVTYNTNAGNAELVLTGSVITLGTKNLFVAQIERIIDGGVEHGAEESYETNSDGILHVIPRLAQALTGVPAHRAIPPTGSSLLAPYSLSPYSSYEPYVPTGGTYEPTEIVPQGTQNRQTTPAAAPGSAPSTAPYSAPNSVPYSVPSNVPYSTTNRAANSAGNSAANSTGNSTANNTPSSAYPPVYSYPNNSNTYPPGTAVYPNGTVYPTPPTYPNPAPVPQQYYNPLTAPAR